jgi:hypothetical protein
MFKRLGSEQFEEFSLYIDEPEPLNIANFMNLDVKKGVIEFGPFAENDFENEPPKFSLVLSDGSQEEWRDFFVYFGEIDEDESFEEPFEDHKRHHSGGNE